MLKLNDHGDHEFASYYVYHDHHVHIYIDPQNYKFHSLSIDCMLVVSMEPELAPHSPGFLPASVAMMVELP